MKKLLITSLYLLVAALSLAHAEPPKLNQELWGQMQQAVLSKDLDKVKVLLNAGIDVNDPIGCGTFNPVDGAVQNEDLDMVWVLLKAGAKPNGRALLVAARHGPLSIVKALLDGGADVNFKDKYGFTAISSASGSDQSNEDLAIVQLLLSRPGIKLDEFTVDRRTALMYAVENGALHIAEALLRAGADARVTNSSGESAKIIAEGKLQQYQSLMAAMQRVIAGDEAHLGGPDLKLMSAHGVSE